MHERRDDLESIVHVLIYFSFRYLQSAFTPEDLEQEMTEVFDHGVERMGIYTGGRGKEDFFQGRKLTPSAVNASFSSTCPPLAKLINSLRNRFAPLYETPLQPAEADQSEKVRRTREQIIQLQETSKRDALETLNTSTDLIGLFNHYLESSGWSPEGAVDRLPRVAESEAACKRRRESEAVYGRDKKRPKLDTSEDP